MAARVTTWIALIVGGTGGTLAALAGGANDAAPGPARSGTLPLRPLGEIARQAPSASATPSAPSTGSVPAAPVASAVASEAPAPSAAPATSASEAPAAKASAALPAAELLPLPETKEKLLRAEMHCDQAKAEACIVAARSFESGSAGATDPAKAAKYRRIALTAWIGQCDHNSAAACATLASMYRAGSGVPQSDRNAEALLTRARELCRFNDAPVCHELPAP